MRKLINVLPLIILGMLAILLMTGRVRFGFGMVDIIYHGLVYLGLVIYGIYFMAKSGIPYKIKLIYPILGIALCAYLILTMTIWRGGEYSWDGNILVPTQKTKEKENQKEFENRLAELDTQIEINPTDYDLRLEKGYYLRSKGKYEAAIEVLKKAQEVEPEEYSAYREAGYVFYLMKDYENTILEYEKAYQTDTSQHKLKIQIQHLKEKYQKK